MVRRIAVDKLDPHARMSLVEGPQQVREKARGERGEDAHLDAAVFGTADRRDILGALANLPKRLTRAAQELLSRQCQEDAAAVPLKERSTKMVFEISDSATNR